MTRGRCITAILAACSLSAACSLKAQRDGNPFGEDGGGVERNSPQTFQITVIVNNEGTVEASIRAVVDGLRRSLGAVRGGETKGFQTRWSVPAGLYFEVRFLSGASCVTPKLRRVTSDEEVRLTIKSTRDRAGGDPQRHVCTAFAR